MSKIRLNIINEPDDYECAQVRVDATVEGDEFDFLLDTGAALSRIRKSEFTIQYPKVKSHASSGVLSKSNEDLIRIHPCLDQLRLAAVFFHVGSPFLQC